MLHQRRCVLRPLGIRMRHPRRERRHRQNQHIPHQPRRRQTGQIARRETSARGEREEVVDAFREHAGTGGVDDVLVGGLDGGKGAFLFLRKQSELSQHTLDDAFEEDVARFRGHGRHAQLDAVGETLDERAAETVAFDAEDEVRFTLERVGDPRVDGSETDGVEVRVDAPVAVEDEVANEVGAEHRVLEGKEVAHEVGFVREVLRHVALAAAFGDHFEAVVWVAFDPGLD